MKKQLSLLSALVVGTVVSAQAPEPHQTGMGLYEVDMDYDSAGIFSAKQDNRFDQAEAFTRDIVSFVAAQGYKQPANDPFKSEFSSNPANNRDQAAAYDMLAQNGMFSTMASETIPLPQLLDKDQSMVRFDQNANPGCPAPPTSNPVCVAPPMTICPPPSPTRWSCPKPSKSFKPSTHTVYVSVETNRATKSSLCQETCGYGSYSDSDSDCEEPKKTKQKHHKKKHYKHKEEKEKWEPEVEELDENKCFGRAVLSISSDGGENVATIGQNLYQVEPHTALAAIETNCKSHECKSHCGGTDKNCCSHGHCACDGYHTILVSVRPEYNSQRAAPKHTVIEAVETGSVSHYEQPTHTALQYVESHDKCERPCSTHVAYKAIESSCKPKCESKWESKCESKCEPKWESKWEPKNTHTVYESVESNCKSKWESKWEHRWESKYEPKNTHTVYESVESNCKSKWEPKYKPTCEPKWESKWEPKVTHTVYESVESNCEPKSEHKWEHRWESKWEPKSEPKWESKYEPKNTHNVYESVESKCEPKCESKY
ncbi:hypothetical protein IWW46_003948 [Coemansia sp. RSA 2440]|nr:hypothetical protein IWW46_003948 [Coemansia sp. RSA 2440]